MSTFEKHRLEFADQLRRRREQAGKSGNELAHALGWTNSKISKIERGRQTPTDSEVVAWMAAVGADEADTVELRDRLRELRIEQIAWRRQVRDGHRARQQQDATDEASARIIRAVDVAAVPGLLQTPDYARHIFRSQAELLDVTSDDIEDSVRARMQRQSVLYSADQTVKILMTETALANPVCPADVLAGQVDRLTVAVGLPSVRFGIIPAAAPVPFVPWHGFWIVDDVVFVETISEELRVRDPDQVEIYRRMADGLWAAAVEGDAARALLFRIAQSG